jgi:hypothetical protein
MEYQNFNNPGSQQLRNFVSKLKPKMLIIELVAAAVIACGIYLKHKNAEGASLLIAIPLIVLAMLYYFSAFAVYERDEKVMSKITVFIKYMVFWGKSTAIIAILFDILHWQNSGGLYFAGFLALIPSVIVSLYYKLKGNESEIFNNAEILRSIIVILFAVCIFYFNYKGAL